MYGAEFGKLYLGKLCANRVEFRKKKKKDSHAIICSQKHTFQKIPNSAIRISYFIEAIAQFEYFCLVNVPKLLIISYRLTKSRISPGGKARIREALESNTNLERLW